MLCDVVTILDSVRGLSQTGLFKHSFCTMLGYFIADGVNYIHLCGIEFEFISSR